MLIVIPYFWEQNWFYLDLRPQPKEMGLGSDLGIVQSPIAATDSSSCGQEEFIKKQAEWVREMMKATKEIEELKG